MRHLTALILLVLAACASGRPDMEVTSATPASVTVWGRVALCFTCAEPEPVVSEQQMTDAASAHFAKFGKVARRAYEQRARKSTRLKLRSLMRRRYAVIC